MGARAVQQIAGVCGVGGGLAPVSEDLHAVLGSAQVQPVVEATDLRTRALVHGDDAVGGRGVQRGAAGLATLRGRQSGACGGADAVVCVGGQGPLGWYPAASARPGTRSRSADDATAEWTSTRAKYAACGPTTASMSSVLGATGSGHPDSSQP